MAIDRTMAVDTTLRVKLAAELPDSYLERVGRAIVARIEQRTSRGTDKDGAAFVPYSKEYMDSLEFKIARKGTTPNLRLSGEMLADFGVLGVNSKTGEILIGFTDSEQMAKAHGHITGDGTAPQRNFLGISDDELASILSKIPTPQQFEKAKSVLKDIARLRASDAKKAVSSPTGQGVEIVDIDAELALLLDEMPDWEVF